MSNQLNQLQKLGLSQKEARLYLVSLETGPATVAKLAQKSGLKRGTIYEFLGEMLEQGLLEMTISGKRKFYVGVEPKKLNKIIDRQKEILENLLPDLSLLTIGSSAKPKIRFYEGREGMLSVFYDVLDLPENSEVLGFATYEGIHKLFSKKEIDVYIQKRAEKKIHQKLIVPTDEYIEQRVSDNKKELREIIMIPRKSFQIKSDISIYQNKVAIVSLADEQVGVIIESSQVADTQRAIFNLLWSSLKKSGK
ncbi:MAG: Transcriptional regulator, TrmB [Candidatus Moranbacteria bacterium GW2011_GWE1_36_7]|nr:MAG: Transcriptional regulator, TrmB [Candidatus Moranbacteria bacterium GW2011_GWD2_36_12]KKQ06372.1 MAG: Transcriptional regulator, TrmB [Candidatus Moranbacteria bacterium GW2011_GWE2_36_40]KKQ11882.1 MAG: Transcriptional regulator, TrmB [Candidatus Moranbacteria bacterium GW2011_GWE1_36_7]